MNILLTNDDGYDAPGLTILAEVLSEYHNVCIVAPVANRSGSSSCICMYRNLALKKINDKVFALDGSPVDCVISALKGGYIPFVPDVVISGINRDGNIGTDIIYSGTCGAARQASLYSVPGIALSVEKINRNDTKAHNYKGLAELVLKNLDTLISLCGKASRNDSSMGFPYFVNVNAPSVEQYRGVRFASLSFRDYNDSVLVDEKDGCLHSNCIGGDGITSLGGSNCDQNLLEQGYVTVSCVHSSPSYKNPDVEEKSLFVL